MFNNKCWTANTVCFIGQVLGVSIQPPTSFDNIKEVFFLQMPYKWHFLFRLTNTREYQYNGLTPKNWTKFWRSCVNKFIVILNDFLALMGSLLMEKGGCGLRILNFPVFHPHTWTHA